MQIEAVNTERPNTDPTERSMPPDSMTIVSASTTRPVSANCRLRSEMFESRIEVVEDTSEHDQDDDQRQKRNGVVHPTLGQQLAYDVIGDEAVA